MKKRRIYSTVAACGGCSEDGYTIVVTDLDTGEYGESDQFRIVEGSSAVPTEYSSDLPTRTILWPCRPNPSAGAVTCLPARP